jgi:iron complex outermembrane recepter protein
LKQFNRQKQPQEIEGRTFMKSNTLLRASLLASAASACILTSAPAFAQEAAEGAEEVIIVTGSRIASPAAESASPLQVVSAANIEESGVTNIQELLLKNPAFGSPTFARTNTAFATAGVGVATVDLRNLGVDRTLVLINGRRVVSGVPGSFAVDLNIIPTPFLEGVDVLTGGASAVYGSDAVAGVVNFRYKTDFDGLELNGKAGFSPRGDDGRQEVNLTFGKNFADDRANVMLYGGYSKEGKVLKRNRSTEEGSMAIDETNLRTLTGNDEDYFKARRPFLSGFAPQGRYYTDNIVWTYGPSGALQPCATTNGLTCGGGAGIGPNGFNRSEFRYMAVPVERFTAAGRANFEASPAANLFLEVNYAKTKSTTNIEPFPLASDDIKAFAGDSPSGQINMESLVNGVLYRNPYIPDAIFNDSSDSDGDGLRDIFFDKRLADFGPRAQSVSRDTFRIVGGINGSFLDDRFKYEVYGLYGSNKEAQNGSGQFNGPRFFQALQAIRDVNDLDGDNNRTEIICANAAARAAGCIPANPFGVGSLAPATSWLAAPSELNTKVTQTMFAGNVSGELFSLGLGADAIQFSIGGEYRKETSRSEFDELTQGGLNGGNELPATRGKFDVYEGFGEVQVPIIQDRPMFHSLSVRGAVRVSDYSTVGQTFSYNYGGEWAPIEDIRFRVMQARSVRAPNVDDLFAPPQQDFPSGLEDPCEGITLASTGATATNCLAAPGVRANIAANGGVFAISQADLQGITSFAGGNLALKEEKGDSFTAGVVINPRSVDALRNLVFTADYFNIRIKSAIVDTPLQFILDQCYSGANTELCDFIVRRPTAVGANNAGSLDEVNSGPSNSGGTKTSGLDFTLTYSTGLNGIGIGNGTAMVRVSYTRLLSGFDIPLPGSDKDRFAGEVGASKNRWTATTGFEIGSFGLNFTGTYIGDASLDDQRTGEVPGANPLYIIKHQFYLDAQARIKVGDDAEFFVGGDNLLDNKPPFLADLQTDAAGQSTATGVYDALGRRFYVGFRGKF